MLVKNKFGTIFAKHKIFVTVFSTLITEKSTFVTNIKNFRDF